MSEIFDQFVANIILLLVGGVFIQILLHRYSKSKDIKESRERTFKAFSEFGFKYNYVLYYWNKWIAHKEGEKSEENKDNLIKARLENIALRDILSSYLLVNYKLSAENELIVTEFLDRYWDFQLVIIESLHNNEPNLDEFNEKYNNFQEYLIKIPKVILKEKIG